jgi:hypothetical protein
MGTIASWLSEKVQAKQVDLIAEDTLLRLKTRDGLLDPYFPIKTYTNRDFVGYLIENIPTLAAVVGVGAPIPSKRQGKLRELTTRLVKLALGIDYDEETQWKMREMLQLARANGTTVQDTYNENAQLVAAGTNQALADYLFGNAETLVKAIMDTLNLFSWQIIQTGAVNYTDPYTNTTTTLDWKDPDADYNHFPNALTNNPADDNAAASLNPGTIVWTNEKYANGLRTIEDAIEVYMDTTGGLVPEKVVMSRHLRKKLMYQKPVIDMASKITTTPMTAATMSPDILNAIMAQRELPALVTFDEQYGVEISGYETQKANFLNRNRFAFLSPNMGERAMGVTMESTGGDLNVQPKTGVYVHTFQASKSPMKDRTEAIATALPIVLNPKKLYSQQVHA